MPPWIRRTDAVTIAELLEPGEAEPLWPLLQQIGVRHAVSLLEAGEQRARWIRGEQSQAVDRGVLSLPDPPYSWSLEALTRLKEGYAEAGFELSVIEDVPPLDRVRLGMPGREEQLDAVCEQIRAMGKLGIPTLCYSWIPIYSWARTGLAVPERGGSLTTEYDDAAMQQAARRPEADLVGAERRCGRTSPTSCAACCRCARRPASTWRCIPTTRRSRPCAGSRGS